MGRYTGKKCRLLSMLSLTISFFLIEIIVGYVTNSMALVADSFHMLSDVASLIIAFASVKISPKRWSKNTFGWARAEVLGALVNSVFLVALCFSILVEAVKRICEMEDIHNPKLILIVGVSGLVVNLIGLFLFREHGASHHHHSHRHHSIPRINDIIISEDYNENEDNYSPTSSLRGKRGDSDTHSLKMASGATQLNMRGVFLHVMADALGSVIVIISALVIWKTDWEYKFYVDPILSVMMVLLILRSVWPLLVESALILLQTVPTHIEVEAIQKKLLTQIDGVLAVHEFHVWQLAGDRIIASAHIRCRNLADYMRIAEKVKEFFHNEGIHSTTIQPEFVELEPLQDPGHESADCVLDCPPNKKCAASTCCGVKDGKESPRIPSPVFGDSNCRQRTNSMTSLNDNNVINHSSNNCLDLPSIMESGALKDNQSTTAV